MTTYNLPFEVLRAAPKSFYVRFNDGTEAFISNANFLTLMKEPTTPTMFILKSGRNNSVTRWVLVAKISWELGFKKPIYDSCGNRVC